MSNTLKWEELHALYLFAKRYEDKDGAKIGPLLARMHEALKLGLVEDRAVVVIPPTRDGGLIVESGMVVTAGGREIDTDALIDLIREA